MSTLGERRIHRSGRALLMLEFHIHVQKEGARSDVRQVHLYYRGQPRQLTLVLN